MREFILMCRGHRTAESRKWERARFLGYITASANRDPQKAFPSIENFLPLPTDMGQLKDREQEILDQRQKAIDYINKTYGKNLA